MWIRSQDKTMLVEVREIAKAWGSEIKVNDYPVGLYETNKRALEVLDEIQNVICENDVYVVEHGIQGYETSYSKVKSIYEMPKE